jgi:hypothetical protein
MISIRMPTRLRGFRVVNLAWALAAAILLAVSSLSVAQNPSPPEAGKSGSSSHPPDAQIAGDAPKQEPPKSAPGAKAKADAVELSDLADQLRDQLHRTDVNILSLDIIQKTEAIEKLSKKIKGEANGH